MYFKVDSNCSASSEAKKAAKEKQAQELDLKEAFKQEYPELYAKVAEATKVTPHSVLGTGGVEMMRIKKLFKQIKAENPDAYDKYIKKLYPVYCMESSSIFSKQKNISKDIDVSKYIMC